MNDFTVNMFLMNVMVDDSFNEEVRKLAEQLLKSNCSLEAKMALIESCIEESKKCNL